MAQAGSCKIKSDHILYLKGDTDEKMLDCVRGQDLTDIDTVLLKSRGGSVKNALKIGNLIAPLNAHMIVEDYCNSSCANYFLPVARKVTIRPEAEIILHGSVDEGGAKKYGYASSWDMLDKQQAYALKHRIHRGWLMYRHDYDNGGIARFIYVDGELAWIDEMTKRAGIHVEETLFKSCFPGTPIEFEEPTISQKALSDAKYKATLMEQGFQPSGSWVCKGAFDPDWPVPGPDERQIINNE